MRAATLFLLVVGFAGCRREVDSADQPASRSEPRIVSLSPSATEVVAAVGAIDRLVGVDDYSNFPPRVVALPKVGKFLTPNLEAILKLKPTLVVTDDVHARTAAALRDAGIAVVDCPVHGMADLRQALERVGAATDHRREAQLAIDAIERALDSAASRRPPGPRPRVLAIIDREPGGIGGLVAAGPGSWIDELLAVVGAANVLAGAPVRYPKISLEEVAKAAPEVILDLSFAARSEVAAWGAIETPALHRGRIIASSEPFLLAPSPRVPEALTVLERAVR